MCFYQFNCTLQLQIDVLLNIFVALRTYWLLLFSALQIQLINTDIM